MNDTLSTTAGLDLPFACGVVERDEAAHERIRVRTRALALRAGRVPPHVLQVDYEQAKHELAGGVELW